MKTHVQPLPQPKPPVKLADLKPGDLFAFYNNPQSPSVACMKLDCGRHCTLDNGWVTEDACQYDWTIKRIVPTAITADGKVCFAPVD